MMAGLWPLRSKPLHTDFCAGERVNMHADIMRRAINGLFRLGRDNTLIAASLRLINRVSSRMIAARC
ncbi:hypothetical protein FEI15_03330 [Lacticaseibacillus zeae]|uniref:Uncharacterized protein n=1 Tax=Lacticaseibacillus zeae TaxID=57037 RepID=A0A5R8LVL6_LACZE|nr:hypothetical protein FEI15_03330 [Lacticaseibacillus zeae]TLF42733.1 hypothetical protein FEI14_03680 [Lacticaseibacillus zeae]